MVLPEAIPALRPPARAYVSIDKLDASQETAPGGAVNLGAAQHLTYNDLDSTPLTGTMAPAFGYFNSDGAAESTPGITIGRKGGNEWALQIFNPSQLVNATGLTSIGTAAALSWKLNTIAGVLLKIANGIATGDFHAMALDDLGNLAIAGGLYLPGSASSSGCAISSGTGAPATSAPGTHQNGSLYLRLNGTTGARLYVSNGTGVGGGTGTGWTAVANV